MEQIKKRELERKIKSVLSNMPVFVGDYLRRINGYSTTSKIEYLYDLGLFLNYLVKEEIDFIDKNIKDLTYDDLNRINLNHIEGFLEYIVAYEIRVIDEKTGKEKIIEKRNGDAGIHRRASSLRSFFSNLYIISLSKDESDDNRLKKNIAQLIKLNKVKRKQ